jgi:3-oxoacyl-[acyl-carrier protein] reductase
MNMTADFRGKTALVTGSGRGIGRAIAARLAADGAGVFLTARSIRELEETAHEIRSHGGRVELCAADLTEDAGIDTVFNALEGAFGGLDILVNNAGVAAAGPLVDFPVESFDTMMSTNVRALFLCCQRAMRLMVPARRGSIINISSVVGFKGYASQSVYAASKHAVMGITKSLAVEAQPYGIRVSAVLPGGVDTEIMATLKPELDRSQLMRPDDVVDAVEFLLSLSDSAAVDEIYIRRRSSAPF